MNTPTHSLVPSPPKARILRVWQTTATYVASAKPAAADFSLRIRDLLSTSQLRVLSCSQQEALLARHCHQVTGAGARRGHEAGRSHVDELSERLAEHAGLLVTGVSAQP